jgi:hypothetical protein
MTAVWTPVLGTLSIYVSITTAIYVVILGIPTFLVLRAKGKLNLWNLAATGFLCSTIPMLAFALNSAGQNASPLIGIITLGFWGGLGLISAVVFGGTWNLLSAKQDRFPWHGKLLFGSADDEQG